MNKKLKPTLILIILLTLRFTSFSQFEIDTNYQYSELDTINGQIETAKRMKKYMDEKQYEKAISLFSVHQQQKIKNIQKNESDFANWCIAWTITDEKLTRFISRIQRRKGYFVFEDKMWKIDEN
jgi:hypothetical protein